jgi:hypothetical protein
MPISKVRLRLQRNNAARTKQRMVKYQNIRAQIAINKYIISKTKQRNVYNYDPIANNCRYLVIMACHCNSSIKFNAIVNNLPYFKSSCIDIILINSFNLPYNSQISDLCQKSNIKYYEMDNIKTLDFGKWVYSLEKLVDYSLYNYTILTNDSFIIHSSINHFFNLMFKNNVELYGYNDSTQERYHYQSYLFGLRKDAIPTFILRVNSASSTINVFYDVIQRYELRMTDWFRSFNCFVKIGNAISHKGLNIFFNNDNLYFKLKNTLLLPFTKIKRIQK